MAALVAYFVSERSSTYAAASGLVLAASLLSSVVQPLFGALTDRRNMPWLLPVSTVVGGAGVALAGVGGSYALSLAAVALSGIGVAACHPQAARTAHAASRGSHAAMGWFYSAATSASPRRPSRWPPSSPPAGCAPRPC